MGKQCSRMENLNEKQLNKYQVTIHFNMDDDFMSVVPAHRVYINDLITKGIIDYYSVSMETHRCWITINALDKKEVTEYLEQSPLFKYWSIEIDELFVYDGQNLPTTCRAVKLTTNSISSLCTSDLYKKIQGLYLNNFH